MNASAITANVITGIIAGVSAGVILAILVESKRYVDLKMKRCRQIRYIRQIVEKFQELILSAKAVTPTHSGRDNIPPELRGMEFPLDMVRGAYFGDTYREIVETLGGRADTLAFDEKREVQGAFAPYNLPTSHGQCQPTPRGAGWTWLIVSATNRRPQGGGVGRRCPRNHPEIPAAGVAKRIEDLADKNGAGSDPAPFSVVVSS